MSKDTRRECDLVMRGGITSGIVYPRLVSKLAEQYTFRNIGGTSAGAIAASLAAAAEYGRGTGGFKWLAETPERAGSDLSELFQPTHRTRPLMAVLLEAVSPGSVAGRVARAVLALVRFEFLVFGLAVLSVAALYGASGFVLGSESPWTVLRLTWPGVLITGGLLGVVASVASLLVRAKREIPRNGFGISNGMPGAGNFSGPALTPWLHEEIKRISGKRGVLTLRDLWTAKGSAPTGARDINFEVMTSDLTEGLAYRFPLKQRTLAFCPECLRPLFPAEVYEHLVARGKDLKSPTPGDDGTAVCRRHGTSPVSLLRMPENGDLPVLFLARLSLSFPGLLSAVPLYKVDRSRRGPKKKKGPNGEEKVCEGEQNWVVHWFSDGGIGSGFPVHFFDALWPGRPTFGVDLEPEHPDYPLDPNHRCYQPGNEFYRRRAEARAQPRTFEIHTPLQFAGRILSTALDWRDKALSRTPGYSERVVTVFLKDGEGGLNLKMPKSVVEALAERGERAASAYGSFDLEKHRWIRYRISMSELDELFMDLRSKWTGPSDYKTFVHSYGSDSYVPHRPANWREEDYRRTNNLMDLIDEWMKDAKSGRGAAQDKAPTPSPTLRLEPRQTESEE